MPARFSLVFPLAQERGLTPEALRAWTRQTLAADRFEIIAVADERIPVAPELAAILRSRDRAVTGRFNNLAQQFDAGIRAGDGEYLFLTESHCLPDPDCLAEMDRFLARNDGLAGACCESIPAWENNYQLIDATTFEEGFRHFIETDCWRKLSVHGMALRRDLYLALGGFQHQYGRFAEMILAAELRDGGHRLGHARESKVTHYYRDTLRELIDGTEEYVASECGYRFANPGPDRVGYSYQPEMPNPFSAGAAALEREVALLLLGPAGGGSTTAIREGLSVGGRVLLQALGRSGPVLAEWLAVAACRVKCWWNRHDARRLDVPYRNLFRLASRLGRARALAARPAIDSPLPAPARRLALESLPEWALRGFHGLELVKGESFRWSGRIAAVKFPLSPGEYRFRLTTRGLQTVDVKARIAFNGTRMDAVRLPAGDYEFRIARSHCHPREQTLLIVCDALEPWRQGVKDYRELGIPIFALEAVPVSARAGRTLGADAA